MPRMNAAEALPHTGSEQSGSDETELKAEELEETTEAEARAIEAGKLKKPRVARKKAAPPAVSPNLDEKDAVEITETEARRIEAAKAARKNKKAHVSPPPAPAVEKLEEAELEEIEEGDAEWIEVAKAAKKKKTPPPVPPDAPRIKKLEDADLEESWEGEAQGIEAEKIDRQMAAQGEEERRKWRASEEARRVVDQLSLEAEREKLQSEELRAAERQAISDLHTERINRQLDAHDARERSAFEGEKPQAKIATRWERAIGWLKKKLG